MAGLLRNFLGNRSLLIVVAAPAEAAAVRSGLGCGGAAAAHTGRFDWLLEAVFPGVELLESGVGKVNAAAAVALRVDSARHAAVINLGICGTLAAALPLGSVVLADSSIYGDEGLARTEGFQTIPQMGFPIGPFAGVSVPGEAGLVAALRPLAAAVGPIATVSTCSGTDALAAEVSRRTGAIAEGMEGAAIGHVLARIAPTVPFAEIRVVSNTTGERSRQRWDIRGALSRLAALAAEIAAP
jgi:futalosine hydrolase